MNLNRFIGITSLYFKACKFEEKNHDWYKSYINVKWWIAILWILLSGRIQARLPLYFFFKFSKATLNTNFSKPCEPDRYICAFCKFTAAGLSLYFQIYTVWNSMNLNNKKIFHPQIPACLLEVGLQNF